MSIADKILFHRKAKNLSQGQLAQKAGINRQTIYNYEKSHINPTLLNIEKIAKALNVEVSDFFDKSPPTTTPSNKPSPLLFEVLGNLKYLEYADDDTLNLINHLLLKSK